MKSRNSEHGFTLLEVLVAIVVLGLAVGSILLVFSNSVTWLWAAGQRSEALNAAETGIAQKLAEGPKSDDDELSIEFPGAGKMTVKGELAEATGTSGTSRPLSLLSCLKSLRSEDGVCEKGSLVGSTRITLVELMVASAVLGWWSWSLPRVRFRRQHLPPGGEPGLASGQHGHRPA